MTASRLDILARLEAISVSDQNWADWDWPDVLDLMAEAGLVIDIPQCEDQGELPIGETT